MDTTSYTSEITQKGVKRPKLKSFDKAALKILAPFLRRVRRNDTPPVMVKVTDEHQKRSIRTKIKDLISKLTSFGKDVLDFSFLLGETSEILREVTKSDVASSYVVDDTGNYIKLNPKYMPTNGRHTVVYKIEPGTTVAAYVAYSQEYVMIDDVLGDTRFPEGIPGNNKCVKSVLCVPVLTSTEGDCIGVIELYRSLKREPYTILELQIAISLSTWMGATIRQNNERVFLLKSSELNNYLATLVEYFFAGKISFIKFVSDIIECSKMSVHAERGTFYVLDEEVGEDWDEEITADVYEEGIDSPHFAFKKKNKQRFSKNSSGFVFHVARRGKLINVSDAYEDPRMVRTADLYGHLTKSLISVPLKGGVGVLGILQVINKQGGSRFTKHDESLLQKIAGYAFLACQHDFLKEQLTKSTYRIKGHEELLKIQLRPCPDDLQELRESKALDKSDLPENFFTFEWIITGNEVNASKYTTFMFQFLLGDQYFDSYTLSEFVLTVKKSYRENPYHNFMHAFTVCHCMFNMLLRNRDKFTMLQVLSLLVATICHDSDHIGYTNNFLEMTNHWLAELYWVSPLENHHFDICMLMIEATGLFSRLTAPEYQEAKKLIKALILSTDLINIFRTRSNLITLIKSKTFDWENSDHRILFLGLVMTICDVSGQCKPFYVAKKVTEGLYREFYHQGDIEKKLGFTPLTMMDREKTSLIPESQIQFLSLICLPSVEILVTIFPNTEELLFHCTELRECWAYIQEKKVVEVWKMDECILNRRRKSNPWSSKNFVSINAK